MKLDGKVAAAKLEYCLRLADDRLVLGHRLSEWCGHAPILEEDLALGNIALDLLGQSSALYKQAAEWEGKGRGEDDFAYLREAVEFKNLQLVEQPCGDFAFTIVRQFLFDSFSVLFNERLGASSCEEFAAHAAKILKEDTYHRRHSSEWLLRLGDGTEESHRRTQQALNELWNFCPELFVMDAVDQKLISAAIVPDLSAIKPAWLAQVREVCGSAGLALADLGPALLGSGRQGRHSEHLGHMLAEMQIVARSFPGAQW